MVNTITRIHNMFFTFKTMVESYGGLAKSNDLFFSADIIPAGNICLPLPDMLIRQGREPAVQIQDLPENFRRSA